MFKKILLVFLSVLFIVPQCFAADLLDFVPNNANLILRSNIKQLVSIPEIKTQIDNLMSQENEYTSQVKTMGFDPLKDVDNLLFFIPLDLEQKNVAGANVALIFEGKFDIEKIVETINKDANNQDKVNISAEDGYRTVTFINGENRAKMMFFDNTIAVIGTEKGVESAKLVKLGKQAGIKTNKDFSTSLAKSNQNATLAVVAAIPNDAKPHLAANESTKSLSTIQYLNLDLTYNTNLNINLSGDFAAATDMKAVEKTLTSFGETVKGSKSPYDVINDFGNNYRVTVEGLNAKVSSLITKSSIDKYIQSQDTPQNK